MIFTKSKANEESIERLEEKLADLKISQSNELSSAFRLLDEKINNSLASKDERISQLEDRLEELKIIQSNELSSAFSLLDQKLNKSLSSSKGYIEACLLEYENRMDAKLASFHQVIKREMGLLQSQVGHLEQNTNLNCAGMRSEIESLSARLSTASHNITVAMCHIKERQVPANMLAPPAISEETLDSSEQEYEELSPVDLSYDDGSVVSLDEGFEPEEDDFDKYDWSYNPMLDPDCSPYD
ncbi:hypothetical protein [Photobacterium sanctipauli]|uniref:hypothetical protein n=1 Tax=Photobacterium sanctipauli TaxID=1342794 RepID=UPI000565FB61|nr:hypothetical protein [Photobacterium sanctipauli]